MIPTRDEAKAILEPYHPLIASVIEQAWAEWKSVQACRSEKLMAPTLYPRTISNYIFDAIARRAIMAFGVDPAVRVDVEAQTFKLHFKGLSARFKKGGEDKLGSNHHTPTSLLFVEADSLLPGMSAETGKVEFIWLPNEIWTDLDRILVIARDGDRLIWDYEIDRSAPAAVVVPLPIKPEPEPGAPLITPKPVAKPDTKRQ